MATLHIEHPITDLQTWLGAFTRFEEARKKAGVRAQSVRQPVDDDKYIYITLDFDSLRTRSPSRPSWRRGCGPRRRPHQRSPARPPLGSSRT
jgi:hypothetical protein